MKNLLTFYRVHVVLFHNTNLRHWRGNAQKKPSLKRMHLTHVTKKCQTASFTESLALSNVRFAGVAFYYGFSNTSTPISAYIFQQLFAEARILSVLTYVLIDKMDVGKKLFLLDSYEVDRCFSLFLPFIIKCASKNCLINLQKTFVGNA